MKPKSTGPGLQSLLAAAATSLVLAVTAAADDGHAAPTGDEIAVIGGTDDAMRKVGEARLKVLLWSVYDSRLYTPSGRYDDGDRPLRLEIQYLRDVRADNLVDRTLVEWQAMGRDHANQSAWLQSLRDMWPDISSNDVLTLELDEQSAATFLHNGVAVGRIEDPEFGQQFIDIWLSRDCTRPELRAALIGGDTAD